MNRNHGRPGVVTQTHSLREVGKILGCSTTTAARIAGTVFPVIRLGERLVRAPKEGVDRLVRVTDAPPASGAASEPLTPE
jgi:hypothetical protein